MNSNKNWELKIRHKAYKALTKFSESDRNKIVKAIDALIENPYYGDIQKIKGEENVWRRRVGAYRIFYEIISSESIVYVFNIERRSSNTY